MCVCVCVQGNLEQAFLSAVLGSLLLAQLFSLDGVQSSFHVLAAVLVLLINCVVMVYAATVIVVDLYAAAKSNNLSDKVCVCVCGGGNGCCTC